MSLFFYASASGRVATILIGVEILLPYLLRRTRLSAFLGFAGRYAGPYLKRMWPHYWVGYSLFAVSFVHAWIPMSTGRMPPNSMTGLWLATIALGLIFVQILVGLVLQQAAKAPASLRKIHFWTMLFVAGLVLVHVGLNGSRFLIGGVWPHLYPIVRSIVV